MPCYSQLEELRLACLELPGSGVSSCTSQTVQGTSSAASIDGHKAEANHNTDQPTMSFTSPATVGWVCNKVAFE